MKSRFRPKRSTIRVAGSHVTPYVCSTAWTSVVKPLRRVLEIEQPTRIVVAAIEQHRALTALLSCGEAAHHVRPLIQVRPALRVAVADPVAIAHRREKGLQIDFLDEQFQIVRLVLPERDRPVVLPLLLHPLNGRRRLGDDVEDVDVLASLGHPRRVGGTDIQRQQSELPAVANQIFGPVEVALRQPARFEEITPAAHAAGREIEAVMDPANRPTPRDEPLSIVVVGLCRWPSGSPAG